MHLKVSITIGGKCYLFDSHTRHSVSMFKNWSYHLRIFLIENFLTSKPPPSYFNFMIPQVGMCPAGLESFKFLILLGKIE